MDEARRAQGAPSSSSAGDDDIQITFKRTAHKIEIDMDQITWADELRAKRFRDQAKNSEVDEAEAETFLNDLIQKVTGRDPLTMPRAVVERVTRAIFGEQKRAAANEGNSETGS